MNIGIVVEYNPFHNGHLYQISEAKKRLSADIIIAVVSGDFVQRGEFSFLDKWEKTKAALDSFMFSLFTLDKSQDPPSIECMKSSP